jgi:molecular chaperone GrpE
MSETENNETEQPQESTASDPQNETAAPEVSSDAADAPPAEAAPPSLEDQLAESNDRLLRALAELENTRRRAERDRIDAQQYGMMRFARDMLSVIDNMERAQQALGDDAEIPEALKAVMEGIVATERDLRAILERHNIIAISPKGEKFDPNFHEAMFEAPGTGADAGTVIDVLETGYRIGERLLRPARVGVAKD